MWGARSDVTRRLWISRLGAEVCRFPLGRGRGRGSGWRGLSTSDRGLDGLPHFVCLCTVGVMQGEQRVGGFLSGIRNGEDVGGGPQVPPAQTFLPVLTGLNLSLNKERRHFRAPSSFPGGHWRNLWGDRHRLRLEHRGRQKKSGLPLWHPLPPAISDRRQ